MASLSSAASDSSFIHLRKRGEVGISPRPIKIEVLCPYTMKTIERGLILSSNENWNKIIFHDLSLVFDDKPILVSTDVLSSTLDLGISKLSLKLLDHKYGNFFYKPEIRVLAASLGFSFESGAEFDSNIGIHIRSWCLKGKKWFALKRSPVIHSFVHGQSENYKAASNYARSAILKLSKAESQEEFNSMMLDIRRNCRKWCDK